MAVEPAKEEATTEESVTVRPKRTRTKLNTVEQIELVNKLHRRHIAKLLDSLNGINTPQIIIDAVNKQFSFYSNDIKNQVLTSSSNHNESTYNK